MLTVTIFGFFGETESSSVGSGSPIPGYQSLSPPPRMSALPLAAVPPTTEFQRNSPRYNSLPSQFRSTKATHVRPNYNQWLPGVVRKGRTKDNGGRSSPEEGGFLEFNNNHNNSSHSSKTLERANESFSSSSERISSMTSTQASPTPSLSSCSLDVSFTSSVNDSAEVEQRKGEHLSPLSQLAQLSPLAFIPALVKRTTIGDFKRKLLQHSKSPSTSHRVSAVELLKASKPLGKSGSPSPIHLPSANVKSSASTSALSPPSPMTHQTALENLIRRSARVSYIANRLSQRGSSRFRTDVLSATIVEGRSEEELADSQPPRSTNNSNNSLLSASPSTLSSAAPIVRRHLSFKTLTNGNNAIANSSGSLTPPSGSSTPIETSL